MIMFNFEANMGLMLDPKADWRPTGKILRKLHQIGLRVIF